jgi:hypothetical protein
MNKRKNTIILLFGLALIIGLLVGLTLLLKKKAPSLEVVYVSPENQTENVAISTQIKIDFNQPLKNQEEVVIELSPETEIDKKLENDNQTLVLSPRLQLHPNADYQLTIKNQKEQLLWQSNFKTEKMQGDPNLPAAQIEYTKENYPLLPYIPYEADKFYVVYSRPLTLKVVILRGSQKEVEPLVFDWIRSHGVDPETHTISWQKAK